jgi:MscS family membrane protein
MLLRLLTIAVLVAGSSSAQISLPKLTEAPKPSVKTDPLGRDTPRGTFMGFLNAAHKERYAAAAEYLQLDDRGRRRGDEIARQLIHIIDQSYVGNIDEISRNADGTPTDGIDRDIVGRLSTLEGPVDLLLVRVNDPAVGQIWLFPADLIKQIPELYKSVGYGEVEEKLPPWAVEHRFLSVPLWLWIAIVVFFLIALFISAILITLGVAAWRRARKMPRMRFREWRKEAFPFIFLLALAIHAALISGVRGLPILYRQYYYRVITLIVLSVWCWALFRLIDYLARRLSTVFIERGQTSGNALLGLGRRVLKAIVFSIIALLALRALGFDTSPVLAGLGIGGVALALASQKTIENVFGGLSVLGDSSIRVGDFVKVGSVGGVVEDIGLRATRIRTIERSIVAIPNSQLYTANVENMAMREKILFRHTIGLRYETTADQLRYVLARSRELLYAHTKVETETGRVRLLRFGASSIDCEFWAYVLTQDYGEFLAVQEDLLLRIMDLIEQAGAGIAFPSQTMYVRQDGAFDEERREAAEKVVQEWREAKNLPFPDFAPKQVSEVRNRLVYPPPESVLSQDENGDADAPVTP